MVEKFGGGGGGGGGGASLVLFPHFMQCKFQGGGGGGIPLCPLPFPPPPPPHLNKALSWMVSLLGLFFLNHTSVK